MMQKNLITLAAIIAIPAFSIAMAMAQQVPAIENVSFTPGSYAPIRTVKPQTWTTPEQPAVSVQAPPAQPATRLPEGAIVGLDRSVVFNYGESLPSVICFPLHVCEVQLQPGEIIQQLDVGDPNRWMVKPANSRNAEGQETAHLIIKPATVGIVSNLVAITDKRTYSLQLVSRQDRAWMPKVTFAFPQEEMQTQWAAYFKTHSPTAQLASSTQNPPAATLDFQYHLKGDHPAWKPVRVYSDQNKTYIQFPAAAKNDEIPVLLVLGSGDSEQLVNYRLDGDAFVVDKVIQRATLISGIGKNQQRVDIVKAGR